MGSEIRATQENGLLLAIELGLSPLCNIRCVKIMRNPTHSWKMTFHSTKSVVCWTMGANHYIQRLPQRRDLQGTAKPNEKAYETALSRA